MAHPVLRTTVRFLSTYQGFTDYGVTLAGTAEEKRVSVGADDRVTVQYIHGLTAAQERAYLDACIAHCTDRRQKAEAWAVAHQMTAFLSPPRMLTPVARCAPEPAVAA